VGNTAAPHEGDDVSGAGLNVIGRVRELTSSPDHDGLGRSQGGWSSEEGREHEGGEHLGEVFEKLDEINCQRLE